MNPSLDSELQKIIMKEHADDAKLKEKREYEVKITSSERGLRDELLMITRLQKSLEEIVRASADVSARLEIAKIRSQSLAQQVDAMHKNIKELRARVEKDACCVWAQRSELCTQTLSLSEQCGVSALLATRARTVLLSRPAAPASPPPPTHCPQKTAAELYRAASLRKEGLLVRRAQLQVVPDQDEHFIRLRNALNFAREKTAAILNAIERKEMPTRDNELQKTFE